MKNYCLWFLVRVIITKNPLLIGEALSLANVPKDIDNNPRPPFSTLGANEICISGDSIEVYCGEWVILSLCGLPPTGRFHWSPAIDLDVSNIRNPTARIDSNVMYTVVDSTSGYSDNLFIKVLPFENYLIDTSFSLLCGQSALLGTLSHNTAEWIWTPDAGLSSDSIRNPIAQPLLSTVYYIEMKVPGCTSYPDSVRIIVDTMPRANVSYENAGPVFTFINNSFCADTYFWDFGDNTYSYDYEPVHEYLSNGTYKILMIAYNAFGSDFVTGYVTVYGIVNSYDLTIGHIEISPNPASNFIDLEMAGISDLKINLFEWRDINGSLLMSKKIESSSSLSYRIFFEPVPNGIYLCRFIANNGEVFTGKVVVLQ